MDFNPVFQVGGRGACESGQELLSGTRRRLSNSSRFRTNLLPIRCAAKEN